MKFIDIFNANKNIAIFKARRHQFKTFVYLMKKSPEDFTILLKNGKFKFFKRSGDRWIEEENVAPKHSEMRDFKR